MFPFEEEELEEIQEEEKEQYYPSEYGIDFSTGKMTGKIVEGSKALATWLYLALQIERYKYYTYSWDYGNELKDLVGKSYSDEYLYSEVERMITDCIEENPYINGIGNLEVSRMDTGMVISFFILTDYGEEEMKLDV